MLRKHFKGHRHAWVSPNTMGTGRCFRDPWLNDDTRSSSPSKLYFQLDPLQIGSFITLTITQAHSPCTSLAQSSEVAAGGRDVADSRGISALASSSSSLSPTWDFCSMFPPAVPPHVLTCPCPTPQVTLIGLDTWDPFKIRGWGHDQLAHGHLPHKIVHWVLGAGDQGHNGERGTVWATEEPTLTQGSHSETLHSTNPAGRTTAQTLSRGSGVKHRGCGEVLPLAAPHPPVLTFHTAEEVPRAATAPSHSPCSPWPKGSSRLRPPKPPEQPPPHSQTLLPAQLFPLTQRHSFPYTSVYSELTFIDKQVFPPPINLIAFVTFIITFFYK